MEITESIFAEGIENVTELFQKLQKAGIHIALDDFGTGYSSLSYIRNIPLNILKIDRSFIINLTNHKTAALTEAIIDFCKKTDIKIVAEGVEHTSEYLWLKEKQCDTIQGYLFSKPLVYDDFAKYITLHS